jgi:hypothetical protein
MSEAKRTKAGRKTAKKGKSFKKNASRSSKRNGITGGFTVSRSLLAGQEDAEYTTMRYETTSAFTATGGAASFLLHKGNSIYRPYSGNTDSAGGYSRMYTQYRRSMVLSSRIEVRLWCGTSGVQEPFRIILIPCTVAQSTIYTAFTNIAQLRDVPHAVERLFSPGASMPVVKAASNSAALLLGTGREDGKEVIGASSYTATSGADPGTIWYFAVGYQNLAGTTTNNLQAQVMIEFKVKWFEPVATAIQVAVNKWGNEEVPPASSGGTVSMGGAGDKPLDTLSLSGTGASSGTRAAPQEESKSVKLTQAEAFEDWTDTESEFASFKEACAKRRKAMRKIGASAAVETKTAGAPS